MAFLEDPVSFHMGRWSQQPLVEDTDRQEATNESRSCLCGGVHSRLSMCMFGLH